MHVYDPMSSLGRTVWRFLLRRAAGRYATHDLSHEMVPLRIPLALVPSRAASIQQVASSRTSAAIAPARTRPKREGARGGRGAEKVGRAVGRGHAAARARQGAHGRAGHGEGARDRCRLRPDAIAPRPAGFGG